MPTMSSVDFVAYEWVDCHACNRTGLDSVSWDGRCPFCDGSGECLEPVSDRDNNDEEG